MKGAMWNGVGRDSTEPYVLRQTAEGLASEEMWS